MRTIFLSAYILLCTSLFSQTISSFESSTDVLVFLNNRVDFTNTKNGVTLSFSDMGGRMRSNKGVDYYNPEVTLLSRTRATVTYESLTSGGIAKLIVDCKENLIADRSDMTIYSAINSESNYEQTNRFSSHVIVNSITIGKLVIAKQDILLEDGKRLWTNWDNAKSACSDLGNGWRLPTKDELYVIYKNKIKIGGISNNWYWSSTKGVAENAYPGAWNMNLGNGHNGFSRQKSEAYVRAVRSF
jgi:hypothetical protein